MLCDLSGLDRLFGTAQEIADALRRDAADRRLAVRIAIASTRTAARLLAYGRAGVTVVEPGGEAAALAPLPLAVLDRFVTAELAADCPCVDCAASRARVATGGAAPSARRRVSRDKCLSRRGRVGLPVDGPRRAESAQGPSDARFDPDSDLLATLLRWGLKTLGDLAALPAAGLSSRLGQEGLRLQRLARGEDPGPLVPLVPADRFDAHLDLEWPIEGLEPLSFVLGRLLDPVSAHLERRGRAAAATVVELRLVSRDTHVRRVPLPAPIRDARTLRTLILLDLESHPPGAGIDAVTVRIEPTPGRVLQHSLLERAQPKLEELSTLLARLTALMGQDRCGSPRIPDSHRPGAFEMAPFAVERGKEKGSGGFFVEQSAKNPPDRFSLRRYRHPVPIRVIVERHRPVRVMADRLGIASGTVGASAGPWRTSGEWWTDGWTRDEWDVALEDGTVCRIFQDRASGGWFMDGVVD